MDPLMIQYSKKFLSSCFLTKLLYEFLICIMGAVCPSPVSSP